MALTPSPVQAFRTTGTLQAGVYTLINGTAGKTIVILRYNIKYTGGTITLRDTTRVVFDTIITDNTVPSNNYFSGGLKPLTLGAGLEVVLTDQTIFDACFEGFIS